MFKLLLGLFVIASFTLRIPFIFSGSVSFHYDMARDAFVAKQIWQNYDLKIQGPPTSTVGLYHGPLYYYLIAPFYGLSNGDPRVVAVFLSMLNALVIIPLMLLARDLLGNTKWAILAGLFFAISFEAIQYAPWISNPAPAVLTIALYFYFLRVWQKGNIRGLYLTTLMAALSTQFQFFLIYLLVLIPIFGVLFKLKTNKSAILISAVIAFLGLGSFIISTLKFNSLFQTAIGFLSISAGSQIDFRPQFSELLINYINRLVELFTYNFIPINVFLGGILTLLVIFSIKKSGYLLFCLFSNLLIFIFGGHTNTYANVGLIVPATLGLLFLFKNLIKFNKAITIILFIIILSSNLYAIFKYSPAGQIILVIPNGMNLKNELSLIDKTYELADNNPFSINSLTLPLWTNTTWAYLYSWYGKNKYGYVPNFYGHNQVGLLGDGLLAQINNPLPKTFFIIEPPVGIPDDRYNWEIGSEDSKTNLIREYSFGDLRLQFRKPKDIRQ
ncbi:glycosyltransferase family 39 protein [Candidatus Daviesbacteria bacterium]|nr:glycosyltransferase family 39 protein [Candidatus Daviesbacteria bacterium]